MQKRAVIGIACLLFQFMLSAQCPGNDVLWNRIKFLRETSNISAENKILEVEGYLSVMPSCSYRNDTTHASLLSLAGTLYFQTGNFQKSVVYRSQAIALTSTNAIKLPTKQKLLPGLYYWLSVAYDSLGKPYEKMKALDSCSTIAMRLNYVDRASLTAIYTRLVYFFDIGDYRRCIDYAARCQSLAREYGITNSTEEKVAESYISSSFGWQVIALLKLKDFAEAEKLLTDKVAEYKSLGLLNYLGTTYSQLAEVQLNKGEFHKAILFYRQAFDWDKKAGYTFNCKQSLKDVGSVYFNNLHNSNLALSYYQKALNLTNNNKGLSTEDAFETLDLYSRIATLYVNQKKYPEAFQAFQKAFDQLEPGSNENTLLTLSRDELLGFKKIHYLTRLFIEKANAHVSLFKYKKQIPAIKNAIAVYKRTDQLLDRIRAEQKDPQSKLFWRSDSRILYDNAIEACYLAGNTDDAFYFLEKSRAVLLADQLNEQKRANQQIILEQAGLKKKIQQLEKQSSSVSKLSRRYAQLQSELFSTKQTLDRLQQNLGNYPDYNQNTKTNVFTVNDVKKRILKDHQAFMQMMETDSAVYALFITASSSVLKKIPKSDFDSYSHLFINYLSQPKLLNSNFNSFAHTARQLHQLIFANTSLPKGRLIISPDATNFPYEALISSNPGEPLTYFINDYALSYTYSAQYLTNTILDQPEYGKMFYGMAPVHYSNSFHLASLPGSDIAIRKLKNNFGHSTITLSRDATKNKFLADFYRYKIVQLYTHSTDSGYNNEPTIYFNDSALVLSELIYENKPATNLIILSACETGSGKSYKGEGIFSFSRGFAGIGVPSTLTNLWQVDNESMYELTSLFYKKLSEGLPMDVALQQAKIAFLKTASMEKRLPYFWAASVLSGQSGIIKFDKPFSYAWLVIAISLVGLIILGYGLMKKHHSSKRKIQKKDALITPDKSSSLLPL